MSAEAIQAVIEHRRTMKAQRQFAAANRARIDAEWDALEATPLTAADHGATVRRDVGEARWAQMCADEGIEPSLVLREGRA